LPCGAATRGANAGGKRITPCRWVVPRARIRGRTARRIPKSIETSTTALRGSAQARHVFSAGNGCRCAGMEDARLTILETGFGFFGLNFLATWRAWRDDAQRCERLHFVSIEKHRFTRHDLGLLHAQLSGIRRASRRAARRGGRCSVPQSTGSNSNPVACAYARAGRGAKSAAGSAPHRECDLPGRFAPPKTPRCGRPA
jgi:hypothetical protein